MGTEWALERLGIWRPARLRLRRGVRRYQPRKMALCASSSRDVLPRPSLHRRIKQAAATRSDRISAQPIPEFFRLLLVSHGNQNEHCGLS